MSDASIIGTYTSVAAALTVTDAEADTLCRVIAYTGALYSAVSFSEYYYITLRAGEASAYSFVDVADDDALLSDTRSACCLL